MKSININIGSDGVNHHPLNNLTFEGGQMSNDIYNLKQNMKEWFKNHPDDFVRDNSFDNHNKGMLHPLFGKTHSQETKKLFSLIRKNGMYKGKNNPMYGKKHTKETINKIKLSCSKYKGELAPNYGKKHTEETKNKISLAVSGKNHRMYGKKHTKETKIKMSLAAKKRYA